MLNCGNILEKRKGLTGLVYGAKILSPQQKPKMIAPLNGYYVGR